jgi:hypothetical protein
MTDENNRANGRSSTPEQLERLETMLANRESGHPPEVIVEEQPIQRAAAPFSQRDHDLLLASVDHVASDWVVQLQNVRQNSERLELMVLERAAKLKNDVTQLFLLGTAVVKEAQRGDDIAARLAEELGKLAEDHKLS